MLTAAPTSRTPGRNATRLSAILRAPDQWPREARANMKTFPLLALVIVLLSGCGAVPIHSNANKSLCCDGQTPEAAANLRADVSRAAEIFYQKTEEDKTIPEIFVGMSISGGGSRAANFGLAALEQLEHFGLLDQLSVISTTSGGGLPGAYYALKGSSMDWPTARELMRKDFLMQWAIKNALPHQLLLTSLTHKDRSDLMAEVFDEVLFQKSTYAALGEFGAGKRPIWLANATEAMLGERIAFSGEFFSKIGSDLLSFPISSAVMASAAFPGVFNNVTLAAYRHPSENRPTSPEPLGYVHLYDGGPADNLGLEALIYMAASHSNARTVQGRFRGPQAKGTRCLLLVVDAYPRNYDLDSTADADPRAWYDHLVDSNFMSAFDTLLTKRRRELLRNLGLGGVDTYTEVDIPYTLTLGSQLSPLTSLRRIYRGEIPREDYYGAELPVPAGHFRCGVWHINLSEIWRIMAKRDGMTAHERATINMDVRLKRISSLERLITQIKTNFRLTGPEGCTSEFLQGALFAAARRLVAEDMVARTSACDILVRANVVSEARCSAPPKALVEESAEWDVIGPSKTSPTGVRVACLKSDELIHY